MAQPKQHMKWKVMPKALEEVIDSSTALPSHTEPTGKVNTWKLLVTTGVLRKTKVLGAPCGHQAPLDNRDLDFVDQLVEVKSDSKLQLNTAFFKSILRAMHVHHREQVTSILPNETRRNSGIRTRTTKLTLHEDYRP